MGSSSSQYAVVTSRANARVKQLRAAFVGQARLSGGLIAVEGDNLLTEALRSGMVLKTIFLAESRELPRIVPRSVEVLYLTDEVFASVTVTESPQGIAALLVPPVHSLGSILQGTNTPLILIAAALQDPGNLGTLIRSAEAFGATGILTTQGTVNPWNQKALRASAGSIFRMPVVGVSLEDVAALRQRGMQLIAAVAGDEHGVVEAHDAGFDGACAILIGNEGSGLGEALLSLANERVTIPCPGRVESLNAAVAGSLLLYEASRQRTRAASNKQASEATR